MIVERSLPGLAASLELSGARTRAATVAICLYLLNKLITGFMGIFLLGTKLSIPTLLYVGTVWQGIHDDSSWYAVIASQGYWRQDTPFFPLFPALMKGLHALSGMPWADAGLLVANVAFVLSLYLAYQVGDRVGGRRAALAAPVLLSLYPLAFYFTSAYTEPLFLVLVLGTWRALLDRRLGLAALLGALGALTRNEGLFLALPIGWVAWEGYKAREWGPKWALPSVAGPFLGAGAYMSYLWARFGSPFEFSHYEKLWGRAYMFPGTTIVKGVLAFPHLWQIGGWYGRVYYTLELASVILVLASLPMLYKTVSRPWFFFTLLLVIVPLCDPGIGVETVVMNPMHIQDYFFSFDRFVLGMVPLFIAWASRLRGAALGAWVGISVLLLAALTIPLDMHLFLG